MTHRDLWRPGGSLPLLAALVAVFIIHSLTTSRSPLVGLGSMALLMGSAYAIGRGRRFLIFSLILLAPAILARGFLIAHPSRLAMVASSATSVVVFGAAAVFVFRRAVFGPGRPWLDRISGAICVYLLMGVIGAEVAGMIEVVSPGSFAFPERLRAEWHPFMRAVESAYLYYSFVTMATVGYGDITPVSPPAQTFSWMLAVAGQMYLAIVVARLVALGITEQDREGRASGKGGT